MQIQFNQDLQNDLLNGGQIVFSKRDEKLVVILIRLPKDKFDISVSNTKYEYKQYEQSIKDERIYHSHSRNGDLRSVKREVEKYFYREMTTIPDPVVEDTPNESDLLQPPEAWPRSSADKRNIIIKRIDSHKNLSQAVDRIEIEIDDEKFTITEEFGRMHIHAHEGNINIKPCVANEITIGSKESL